MCHLINCGDFSNQKQYADEEKYLCVNAGCSLWGDVWWTTESKGWTSYPKSGIAGLKSVSQCGEKACNIIRVTINSVKQINNTLYSMGINTAGRDPLGYFRIMMVKAKGTSKNIEVKCLRLNLLLHPMVPKQ